MRKCICGFKSVFIYLVFFLILILNFSDLYASHGDVLWDKTYGGTGNDYGYSVKQTIDGGFIVAGCTDSYGAGNFDFYVVKTDINGDTAWTRTFGGSNDDIGYSVCLTRDSGYVISGFTSSFGAGDYDVYLIKLDKNGNTIWTKTYGDTSNESGNSVQQTSDGGFIIAGYTNSYGAGAFDFYLIKTDSTGDTLWTRTYGGGNWDRAYSVQQTDDGGYVVVGYTSSFGSGGDDIYLVKTDSTGDTLWTRTYGGTGTDDGEFVQQTSDEGYIIVGYTTSYGAGNGDVYLIKTNSNGDTLWTKTYGGSSDDAGYSIQQTDDGGYIIGGYTRSFGAGNTDFYLIKTDSTGDTLWTRTYGGSNYEFGYSAQQINHNGYIMTGRTASYGAGNNDIYLIKINDFYIIQPNGGEYVIGGEPYDIIWNNISVSDSICIYYSTDSGATYPDLIGKMYNTSEYDTVFTWNVPNIDCKSAKVKVITFQHGGSSLFKTSENVFIIDSDSPSSFSLISPVDSDTTSITPLFEWQKSSDSASGLSHYEIYVDNNFLENSQDTFFKPDVNNRLAAGWHTWYVKAVDNAGLNTSSLDTFNLFTASFHLLSPPDSDWSNQSFPSFSWEAFSPPAGLNLTKYQLLINNNVDRDSIPPSDTTITSSAYLGNGTYSWYVRAVTDDSTEWPSTEVRTIGIDKTAPNSFDLISPVDSTATDTLPAFVWHSSLDGLSGIEKYELWIDDSLTADSIHDTACSSATIHTGGTHSWYIVAVDKAGNETQSGETGVFTVDTQAPVVPVLIAPDNGMVTNDTLPHLMTFVWSKVAKKLLSKETVKNKNRGSLVRYNLEMINGSDTTVYDSLTDTTLTLNMLSEGNYKWHVQAFDEAGYYSLYSGFYTFVIDTTAPGSFDLISPVDSTAMDTMPAFVWHSSLDGLSGIEKYELWADDSLTADSIHDTTCSSVIIQTEGIHSWYIIAEDSAGNRKQSDETGIFTVDAQIPQTPTLISPEDSSILSSTSQILMWGSVSKAAAKKGMAGDRKRIDNNRGSLVRYNLEMINGSDTTVYDSLADTTLTLNMLSEGNYNWHVQAFDEAGYHSLYSGYYIFTVDTTAPAITNTTVINDTVSPGPFAIYSKVTDNEGVDTVKLWYKTSLDTVWTNVNMAFTGDTNTYSGEIPAQTHGDTIWYYIGAKDIASPANVVTDPSGAPTNSYSFVCSITGIAESKVKTPASYFIKTVNSNLTGSGVRIEYGLPRKGDVELTIYGLTGRKVVTLAKGFYKAGIYRVNWNGRNAKGVAVKRGVYIAEFKSGDIRKALKIVNIK